jgi:hypothetical protein
MMSYAWNFLALTNKEQRYLNDEFSEMETNSKIRTPRNIRGA